MIEPDDPAVNLKRRLHGNWPTRQSQLSWASGENTADVASTYFSIGTNGGDVGSVYTAATVPHTAAETAALIDQAIPRPRRGELCTRPS